jgi:hypothetical protein
MADYFQFTQDSAYLKERLSPADLQRVTRWQNGIYDFSFHTMHEAGWPLYIIEPGKRGMRDRPKINLKDKTAAQAEILEGKFDNKQVGLDAKAVAVANWALFQTLARMFYEGVTRTVVQRPVTVLEYRCQTPQCGGRTITQEYEGPSGMTTLPPFARRGLGVCKQCKKNTWTFVRSRALGPGEKPDVPLSLTAPPHSV